MATVTVITFTVKVYYVITGVEVVLVARLYWIWNLVIRLECCHFCGFDDYSSLSISTILNL